jgi:hypothetical protein
MILVSPASLTGNIVRYFRCSCNVLSPTVSKNYGDAVSESLKRPELPSHFNELSDREQFEQVVLLRRRQLHFYYVAATARFNLMHYDALAHDFSMLRRKIYDDASWPWEGDNVTLKGYLIDVLKNGQRLRLPNRVRAMALSRLAQSLSQMKRPTSVYASAKRKSRQTNRCELAET